MGKNDFEKLYKKLDLLHNKDEHPQIVELIEGTKNFEADYTLVCLLAQAHNNIGNYNKAIALLESVAEEGQADTLWHYRLGFAYFYNYNDTKNLQKALELVQKSYDMGDDLALELLSSVKNYLNIKLSEEEAQCVPSTTSSNPSATTSLIVPRFGEGEPFDERLYLREMYADSYYPHFLVDKIKVLLQEVVSFIEQGSYTPAELQGKFDAMTTGINDLEEEFDDNDSEIETVARDSIGGTVQYIIDWFDLPLDCETAIQERDW